MNFMTQQNLSIGNVCERQRHYLGFQAKAEGGSGHRLLLLHNDFSLFKKAAFLACFWPLTQAVCLHGQKTEDECVNYLS